MVMERTFGALKNFFRAPMAEEAKGGGGQANRYIADKGARG